MSNILKTDASCLALGKENDNFARCPEEALDWNHRKYLIVEEIIEYCPDVICLQVFPGTLSLISN